MKNKKNIGTLSILILSLIIFSILTLVIVNTDFFETTIANDWIGFLGSLFGAFATILGVWYTLENENEKRKDEDYKRQREITEKSRMEIMPFLEIRIYDTYLEECFTKENADMESRAVVVSEAYRKQNKEYPYRISNNNNIKLFINEYMPNISKKYPIQSTFKKIIIKNIGLQAAVNVNFFINEACVWKYNLGKNDEFFFFMLLVEKSSHDVIRFRMNFTDLYGNEYEQYFTYETKEVIIKSTVPYDGYLEEIKELQELSLISYHALVESVVGNICGGAHTKGKLSSPYAQHGQSGYGHGGGCDIT